MAIDRSDISKRLIGIVYLLPLLALVWAGGAYLISACLLVSALMAIEFARLIQPDRLAQLLTMLIFLMIGAASLFSQPFWFVAIAILVHAAFLARLAGWLSGLFALCLGLCLYALMILANHPSGTAILVILASVIAAVDIGALCAGRLVGGPKLAPRISPGKTWAGAAGGTLAGLLAGIIAARITGQDMMASLAASFVICLLAQIGDLLESALKRNRQVKDSGHLLPGHGGFLDRFDGYILTVPMVALWLAWQGWGI